MIRLWGNFAIFIFSIRKGECFNHLLREYGERDEGKFKPCLTILIIFKNSSIGEIIQLNIKQPTT